MSYTKTFVCADDAEELLERRTLRGFLTAIDYHEDGGATLFSAFPFGARIDTSDGALVSA